MTTKELGKSGEKAALRYLIDRGYTTAATNYRSRYGEIDLIVEQGDLIVFVEVKLRKNSRFAHAFEHVDDRKIEKIIKTAEGYLAEFDPCETKQARFDVIEIYWNGRDAQVNHLIHAFERRG